MMKGTDLEGLATVIKEGFELGGKACDHLSAANNKTYSQETC